MAVVESRNEQCETRATRGYEKFVGGSLLITPWDCGIKERRRGCNA